MCKKCTLPRLIAPWPDDYDCRSVASRPEGEKVTKETRVWRATWGLATPQLTGNEVANLRSQSVTSSCENSAAALKSQSVISRESM